MPSGAMEMIRGFVASLTDVAIASAKRVVLAVLTPLFRRTATLRTASPPQRILVLQLQQLGDTVIFTPTLRAIRRQFPDARIDLLASRAAAQVYRKSPHVDAVHVAQSWSTGPGGTRTWPLLPLLRELRRTRYDCTVTDIAQQSFKYSLIAWLVGAPLRVGFDIRGRGFLHNLRVPFREDANWVDANLDLARALGADPDSDREEVAFDAADQERVVSLVSGEGSTVGRRLVVMHTGSNWQSRTWYHDRWALLADTLGTTHGAAIVFVGSAAESEYVERIRGAMTVPSISLAGVTDIPQLAALCRMADLFVGTDSGPRQIARASGAPHVVIMCSQDDTDRWAGWGRGEIVLRSFPPCSGCYLAHCAHKICMDAIETQRVLDWCNELLTDPDARAALPRQDRVQFPARLAPMVARGRAALRALARAPAAPT